MRPTVPNRANFYFNNIQTYFYLHQNFTLKATNDDKQKYFNNGFTMKSKPKLFD